MIGETYMLGEYLHRLRGSAVGTPVSDGGDSEQASGVCGVDLVVLKHV